MAITRASHLPLRWSQVLADQEGNPPIAQTVLGHLNWLRKRHGERNRLLLTEKQREKLGTVGLNPIF